MHFQPGEGPSPSRGLLHDCEIFAYLWITFVYTEGSIERHEARFM